MGVSWCDFRISNAVGDTEDENGPIRVEVAALKDQRARVARSGVASRWTVMVMGAVMFWPFAAGVGQVAPSTQGAPSLPGIPGSSHSRAGSDPLGEADPMNPMNPRKLEHMREEERHKRLLADTTKLVELTNQLKSEVDKASKDELSLDVVRKAAEIEKLAHDVKEHMKS